VNRLHPRRRTTLKRAADAVALAFLVAWTASLVLWARSYWVETRIERDDWRLSDRMEVERRNALAFRRGRLFFTEDSRRTELSPDLTAEEYARRLNRPGVGRRREWYHQEFRPPVPWGSRGRWGFTYRSNVKESYATDYGQYTSGSLYVTVPWWTLMTALGVVPVWWLWHLRRDRHNQNLLRAGRCVGCGYDLRATPQRCPECGRAADSGDVSGGGRPTFASAVTAASA
jgi:hypothetical protein